MRLALQLASPLYGVFRCFPSLEETQKQDNLVRLMYSFDVTSRFDLLCVFKPARVRSQGTSVGHDSFQGCAPSRRPIDVLRCLGIDEVILGATLDRLVVVVASFWAVLFGCFGSLRVLEKALWVQGSVERLLRSTLAQRSLNAHSTLRSTLQEVCKNIAFCKNLYN